eukprot:4740915-Lingulodinium_polyedra.AAC.1
MVPPPLVASRSDTASTRASAARRSVFGRPRRVPPPGSQSHWPPLRRRHACRQLSILAFRNARPKRA